MRSDLWEVQFPWLGKNTKKKKSELKPEYATGIASNNTRWF